MRPCALWCMSAALLACRADPPAGTAPLSASALAAAASSAPVGERTYSLNLDHADAEEVLRSVVQALEVPLFVDPRAQSDVKRAPITVLTPAPVTRAELVRLVDAALAPNGLALRAVGAGLAVERSAASPLGAPPDGIVALAQFPVQREVVADAAERISAGIREVSPTEREITESARALAAAHVQDGVLGKKTRLVPEPGAEGGIRVFGVRQDSVLGRLGFENGDVVTSFAPGRDGSAASALEALAGMKTAKEATIGLRRQGKALALHYRVVP